MTTLGLEKTCSEVISRYWSDFKQGVTWNYYLQKSKYLPRDNWASMKDWIEAAEWCLSKNINEAQAFEVLLRVEKDKYMDKAMEFIFSWYESGAYDAYRYFDILSTFSDDDEIRIRFLGEQEFSSILGNDGWGYNRCAREALLRSSSPEFKSFLGGWIDSKLLNGVSHEVMEDEIFPLIVELGESSKEFVSSRSLGIAREFVTEFLENDRKSVERYLSYGSVLEGRSLWIADNVAYYSWLLGWKDLM